LEKLGHDNKKLMARKRSFNFPKTWSHKIITCYSRLILRKKMSLQEESSRYRKHVGFAAQVDLWYIPHKEDFLTQHNVKADALWYSKRELRQIKDSCTATLRMIEREKPLDTSNYCSRGLEARTASGRIARRRNRNVSFHAVLNEQATQFEIYRTIANPERIRETYRRHYAAICLGAAYQLGVRDARMVQEHWKESCSVDPPGASCVIDVQQRGRQPLAHLDRNTLASPQGYSNASKEAANHICLTRSLHHVESRDDENDTISTTTNIEDPRAEPNYSMAAVYSRACKKAHEQLSLRRCDEHRCSPKLSFHKVFPSHGIEIALDGGLHAILTVKGGRLFLTPAAA
jgi:hypothetical protein